MPQQINLKNFHLTQGENVVEYFELKTSLVLFWLKAKLLVTDKRLVGEYPNIVLGLIPIGYHEISHPLRNISSIRIDKSCSIYSAIVWSFVCLMGGIFLIFPLIFLVEAVANVFPVTLIVSSAGDKSAYKAFMGARASMTQFSRRAN